MQSENYEKRLILYIISIMNAILLLPKKLRIYVFKPDNHLICISQQSSSSFDRLFLPVIDAITDSDTL